MRDLEFREVLAKSALNRSGSIRADWTLNPYRGCGHACRYCYARATHTYLDLGVGDDFDRTILVKTNLPELLARELGRRPARAPARHAVSLVIGTAADPYQPAEARHKLTRRALEVLVERLPSNARVTIITKGTLIVRDRDVLRRLAERVRTRILFSLSTVDPQIARRLEPGAPSPASRLRALAMLREAGVPTSVLLCPVVPSFTDGTEQLAAVFRAASEAGALDVDVGALRLAPAVREHFLDFVAGDRPELIPMYRRLYRFGSDPDRAYRDDLARRSEVLHAACAFADEPVAVATAAGETVQLGFPEF